MMFAGANVIVLDLELRHSPDDCRHCLKPPLDHQGVHRLCFDGQGNGFRYFEPLGWRNKRALGLSVGGYYDYEDDRIHWFDRYTLISTMEDLVERQPLIVSFNGLMFDYVLMRALVHQRADELVGDHPDVAEQLRVCCYAFKDLVSSGYDILDEVWQSGGRACAKGVNTLDALCRANGLGEKNGDGALAPALWQKGRVASVLNYCTHDIMLTKALFEHICTHRGALMRMGGPILLRYVRMEQGDLSMRQGVAYPGVQP